MRVPRCCGLAEAGEPAGTWGVLPVAGPCLAPVLGARACIAPKKLQYQVVL